MPYRVELSRRAEYDLNLLFLTKNAAESKAAARWCRRLEEAVLSLENSPQRGLVIPESRRLRRELRQLLYGKRTNIYRIIYALDESRLIVLVLTIRHRSMRKVKRADLD